MVKYFVLTCAVLSTALFLTIEGRSVSDDKFTQNILNEARPGFISLGSRIEHPAQDHIPKHHRETRSAQTSNDRGAQNVYYISEETAAWGTAWMACRQEMNGDLLSIETEAENWFIRDLLIKHNVDSVWTSGAFDANLGIWRWGSTGGEVVYANWLAGHPASNDGTIRVAVENSLFSNGWSTLPQTASKAYICEVRSPPVVQPTPSTPAPPEPTTEYETTPYSHHDPPPPELAGNVKSFESYGKTAPPTEV